MEQVMPGQAGAPLGLTLTLVDPMLAARCCASFTKDPRRRHNGRLRASQLPIGLTAQQMLSRAGLASPKPSSKYECDQ